MDTFSEEVVNALAEALVSTKITQHDGGLCWCPTTGHLRLTHTKDCMDRQKALIDYHLEKHQAVMAARRNARGIHGS